MLGMVPPIIQTPKGFLVGEGQNERRCEQTWKLDVTFVVFFEKDGEYYESDPMTVAEWTAFDLNTVPK